VSNLYAVRLTNDPGHINSEYTDDTTVVVWGPDNARVKSSVAAYENKGYRVLEEWEVPDTDEGRATFAGPTYVRADAQTDDR
jgi:hypothetical protein